MTSIEGNSLLDLIQTMTLIFLVKNEGSQLLFHDGETYSWCLTPVISNYQPETGNVVMLVSDNMAVTAGFVHVLNLLPA